MIVTLSGPNDHARKKELVKATALFESEHGDMAIERFDGEETTADRMQESIQSVPFLSTRKLVVLREPSKQKAFVEKVGEIIKSISDSTDVIIYEPKLDKRSSYYKLLKKETDFREYSELDAASLSSWMLGYIKSKQGSITSSDAQYLIHRVGLSQQTLESELGKLLSYNKNITRDTIDLLTEPAPQSTVFELLDAAFSGKTQKVFELYEEQRALRVEPQAIMAMLAWQLHVLALIKAAGTRTADVIAKETALNPFVVRKSQNLLRGLALSTIKIYIADLLEIDVRLKQSSIDPDEALKLYLLKLAHK